MTNITPRSDERWEGGFVRDTTTGEITVKVTQGNVALSTTDIEVGAVEIKNATTDDRVSVSAAGALKVDASSVAVPVTGPLTDTQLRASTVPISGTVTASGPLTDTQIRASALPVSGTVAVSNSFALDATLTGGTTKAIARGGAKGATTAADVTSTAQGTDHQGQDVQIYHGGVAVNPATIRALTSADIVTVNNPTAANLKVDASGVAVPITDNAGSLTVDATAATFGVNNANVNGSAVVTSVTGVQDVMPRKRTGATGLSPNYYAARITSKTTTTPTAATAYIQCIAVAVTGAGTAWTYAILDKAATPKTLIPAITAAVPTTGPLIWQFAEPVLMTSGIDIVTAGTTAGTLDIYITYWQ